MKPTIDYGQQIKEMLIEKGLEQKELAQELGRTRDTVFKALHNHTMTKNTYERYFQAVKMLEIRKDRDHLKDKLRRIQAIIDE